MHVAGARHFGLISLCFLLGAGCTNDDRDNAARWGNRPVAPAQPAGPMTGGLTGPQPAIDAAVPAAADPPSAQSTPRRYHVVILSIDGCRPDALEVAPAPNLLRFAAEGATATNAMTIAYSVTLPSHSSMLSGYDLEHHGVHWNAPQPELGFIKVPTIFSLARAAGFRTMMIMGKGKFLTLQVPETLDEIHEAGGDEDNITDQAIFQARKGNFDLMFIHFPNPDLTGHLHGWMSPAYLDKVAHIDVLFGRLMKALPPDATVIVTADHGGHDFGHGSDLEIDRRIPWMIKGPTTRKKLVVTRQFQTMDTAATALKVLGLQLPPEAQGQVVHEVFQH
jgi:arylsulfatase A-like enzyme